jgi:hypothetical protein
MGREKGEKENLEKLIKSGSGIQSMMFCVSELIAKSW